MQSHLRHSASLGVTRAPKSVDSFIWLGYYYFDDGETFIRKGMRFDDPDQKLVVDVRLTDSPGWHGVEDTDFEMIYGILL